MNLQLPPGAVFSLQLSSDALALILDALAARPYGQVAPLMQQLAAEIGRQNAIAMQKPGNGAEQPQAPESVQ